MSTAIAEELNTDEENDANQESDEQISPLAMSDEETANMSFEDIAELGTSTDEDETTGDDDDDGEQSGESDESDTGESGSDESAADDDGTETDDDGESEGDDGDESGSDDTGDGESGSSDSDGDGDGSDPFSGKKTDSDSKTSKDDGKGKIESKAEEDGDSSSSEVDYEAEHKKLLAPFRANNKDMKVESVDDARTLMQMGANYNKKMAGLKPNLKLIKMLDNNGLLDEEKLSFYIDLEKKDPAAVRKFIKESGIDLDEFDQDAEHDYKSNTYTVDDKEVELDGVLDELQDTKSFTETIDIISNKWDESSKKVLLENPNLIRVINEHVAAGVYSKIEQAIEQERMMGKLVGVSDLDAYKIMGDQLNDAGVFDNQPAPKNEIPKPKTQKTKTVDSKLRNRKKAASSTKAAPSKKGNSEDYNPLSLSDEEFEKVSGGQFI